MGLFCTSVQWAAILFLAAAFIAAGFETYIAWQAKKKALEKAQETTDKSAAQFAPDNLDALARVIEAVKGLLLALKDLPAWFALFLAGLALVWTAATAPGLCPP